MTQKVQTTEEVMQENYWTPSDKKDHKTIYSTELLVENCNEMDATNPSNPTDAYLITYRSPDGDIRRDLVRTAKRSKLFDMYYDKFGPNTVISIDFGPGTINPKLWNLPKPEAKKKRER
jgi:hypothetical protein